MLLSSPTSPHTDNVSLARVSPGSSPKCCDVSPRQTNIHPSLLPRPSAQFPRNGQMFQPAGRPLICLAADEQRSAALGQRLQPDRNIRNVRNSYSELGHRCASYHFIRRQTSHCGGCTRLQSGPRMSAWDGRAFTNTDEKHTMRMIEAINALFRPIVSPTWPNISPPTGRMKNAPAKTENVDIVDAIGSSPGKKAALRKDVM